MDAWLKRGRELDSVDGAGGNRATPAAAAASLTGLGPHPQTASSSPPPAAPPPYGASTSAAPPAAFSAASEVVVASLVGSEKLGDAFGKSNIVGGDRKSVV